MANNINCHPELVSGSYRWANDAGNNDDSEKLHKLQSRWWQNALSGEDPRAVSTPTSKSKISVLPPGEDIDGLSRSCMNGLPRFARNDASMVDYGSSTLSRHSEALAEESLGELANNINCHPELVSGSYRWANGEGTGGGNVTNESSF